MNKRQKEVIKYTLEQEKKIISELKDVYKKALEDIGEKIKILMSDEMTQSKIYQIEYQKALQGQVSAILESLNSNQYERVHDYLKGCYEDGFIGTLYDLQGQGIPLILPLNQEEIVEALLLESKISEGLYTKMGNNVEVLKKNISFEIARGISTSSPYSQIARNLRSSANMTLNQSMRIVRTEGNRIHNKSALNACRKAKEAGADVLKMWDATLDGLTRPRHRQLDGQIREVTEDFEVDGLTVSAPLHFGIAAEDCNCRCHLLTKARWEMDEPFTKWNNEAAELMYFENIKDYQDFKKNYWNHVDNSGKSGIIKVENKSEWENNLQPRGQLPHINEDDLYSFVSNELKIDEKSAIKMTDSVMAFTDDYYTDIRSFQRGEFSEANDEIREIAANIETYIKKAPRWNGGETFRGCTISDDELSTYQVGALKTMGGTSSWSNVENISIDFAKHNVSYERPNKIVYHCDTQLKGTGIKHMSVFEEEHEVICSKESIYEILKIETDNNDNIHVYLKEV